MRKLVLIWIVVVLCTGIAQAGDCPVLLQTVGSSIAMQSQQPITSTNSAANITSTSAVLKGTVNPNGLPTQVDFASKAVVGYRSPFQNIGSGTSSVEVSYTCNGLSPATTYFYSIIATNSVGSKRGDTVRFNTLPPEALSSTMKYVPYNVFTATDKIPEETDGTYLFAEIAGEKYVGIGGIEKFAKLLVEQTESDARNVVVGETWDLGGGWTLQPQSIDTKATPMQVWFVVQYNGLKLDDAVVEAGDVYTYLEESIAGEHDVPMFVTYVDTIGKHDVELKYTWAISRNIKVIENKGHLAVSGGKSIVIFNLTGACNVEKTIQIDQCSRCESITWDGTYFWLASFDTAKIYKVDFSGKVVASFDAPDGTQPSGLAWDGQYMWMSSYMKNGGIYKIDPKDGSLVSKYTPNVVEHQGYGGLAFDSDKKVLWLADAYGSGIYKLKIYENDLKLISQVPSPDKYLSGLGCGAGSLWVYGNQAYKIFRLDTVNGKVVFPISPKPEFGQNAGITFIEEIPIVIPERKTLTIGETWNLGNGYILTAQSIDAKATPRQVWFAISKDGHQLDDKVLSEGQTYTYGTIFSTRIDGIFRGTTSDMVQLKDTHFAPTGVQVTPAPTPIRITDYVRHTPTPQEDDSSIWGWVGLFAGLGALLVLWLSRKSESSAPTPVNSTKPTVSGGAGVSGDTSMQRADPHINEAKRVIQSAESALWGAMRKGVKIPQNTQQLLQDAKKALAAGDSASAKMYAHKCNKNVDATVKEFEQQKAEQARNEREQRALEQQRKEAREQIEIAIDSLEEARKLGISRMENAEHLLTIAQSFFDSRKYSEAKGNAEKCQDAINKLIEESKPNITLKLPSGMRHNYWKHYDIIITNNGTAHAKNITITFSKALETRELETIPKLNVGEQQTLRIKIRPTEAGDAPIDYSIKFSDLQDRAYEIERTTTIQISTSDETRAVPMHPAPVTPTAERLMEKYARLEYLGGGSFADVYKATKKDGGVVAVKVLRNLDERAENVFFREISIWEKLSHRNIVKLLSPHLKPVPHIEVEYVDGGNLYEALKTGEMDVQAACQIAFDIARALEYAHSKYVLHGDINPKNILLTSTGEAKITDFGLAKVATSSSIVKGYTLAYASKEQVEKGRAEEKTDIYQLGLTFYVMLTGANPFDAGSRYDTDERVRTYSPDPPGKYNPRAGGLDEIIMRCLSKDPGERPSTRELRECIYEFVKKNYSESLHLSEDVDTIISINCRLAMLAAKQGDLPECLSALRYALGKVSDQSARKELNKMIAWMEIRIKKDIVTDTEALADQMGILFKKVGWRW